MKINATEAALNLIALLQKEHGALMFYQSGGCCDGSAPMCYPAQEFKIGNGDVFVGEIMDCPFYIGKAQYQLWAHTDLTLDVVHGRGASFSLEIPTGKRFIIRLTLCGTKNESPH